MADQPKLFFEVSGCLDMPGQPGKVGMNIRLAARIPVEAFFDPIDGFVGLLHPAGDFQVKVGRQPRSSFQPVSVTELLHLRGTIDAAFYSSA